MRLALTLVLLSGCSVSLRPVQRNHALRIAEVTERLGVDQPTLNAALANTQTQCDSLDAKVTAWTATTVVAGVLGGGSGVTSIFTESTPRYVVGGVGVGLAAISALSAYLSVHYSQAYARLCTVNTGGQ